MATSLLKQTIPSQSLPKRTITFAEMPLKPEIEEPAPASPPGASSNRNQIFDAYGHIRPIKAFHISIPSSREKVHYYARMYTNVLVSDARRRSREFELFMELHRRAKKQTLTHGTQYPWDQEVDKLNYKNANAIFVREYDRKWQIFERGGMTYMCA